MSYVSFGEYLRDLLKIGEWFNNSTSIGSIKAGVNSSLDKANI